MRFGVVGTSPERISRLGQRSIDKLRAAGHHLAIWVEGDDEPPLPWDRHRHSIRIDVPKADFAVVTGTAPTLADALRVARPDFVLQFDDRSIAPELLSIPRLGFWRFATELAPLAFWEVFDGLYHSEIRLDRITAEPHIRIPLERRWIKIERHSYRETLENFIEEMSDMPVYVSRFSPVRSHVPIVSGTLFSEPTSFDRGLLLVKLWARALYRQIIGILLTETWTIGVVKAPITAFADLDFLPKPCWLPSRRADQFLADPFLARIENGFLMMAESYDFRTGRGSIVQEFSADGNFTGKTQLALREDCHMSYPFLLNHGGELYCIPETHQKNGAFLWKWRAATRSWIDPRQILFDVPCIDPTPVFFGDLWWLFCTSKPDGVDHKLHVYYASELGGPWKPHPHNPVKVDIRSSRPGGTPFVLRGELYRPAQDCSKHYGWRLVINRVTVLSPFEFAEEPLRVLDSDRLGINGVHTLAGSGGMTLLDARSERLIPGRLFSLLAHKVRRLCSFGASRS